MSLIYKSLQQVAQNNGQGGTGRSMPRHAPGNVGLTKRLVIFLAILTGVSAAGYGLIWWLRGELDHIGPQLDAAYQQAVETERPVPEAVNATPAPAPAPVAMPAAMPRLSTPPRISPPVQTKIGIEDLAKPTIELEQLFVQRAKRNQRIMELDHQLATAWAHDDLIRVGTLLTELRRTAGAQSSLPRKWEGALALRHGNFAQAEAIFSRLIQERRGDIGARINLVQALLGQNKHTQARLEHDRLRAEFPNDAKVRELRLALP